MNKETIQASHFGKKSYAKPRMEAYQVCSAAILTGSDSASTKSSNEEYTIVDEETVLTWFTL